MRACLSCGEENPEKARFCSACGTSLSTPKRDRELRKTVTALFIDLVGSTAMGSRLDPEVLRGLMVRYYNALRSTIERHGGSVQKFIGDAVVAVFGVPVVHEDDALRAVHAALAVRRSLAGLNDELEREFGVRIETRTAINTGEVVVGDQSSGEGFVVGDMLNIAARLEQSAAAGETLLGEATYSLVRHAIRAERLEALVVKGKEEPLVAYRLIEVLEGAGPRERRLGSPLVGRAQELRLIRDALARVESARACHLFTVVGSAGVGKSRLMEEAAGGNDAAVLAGRCLPYGEGITFWPVAEIVRSAAGIGEDDRGDDVANKIATLLDGDAVANTVAAVLAQLIGAVEGAAQPSEYFWAVRRLLESISQQRPLIVVFEDIHWAEPTLLDLIEHIAEMSRDAPLLIVCLARPELFDERPAWGGGKRNATSIHLEPLDPDESVHLIANLLGGEALPDEVSSRIAAASEGTPLFVEEMIAMLVDGGLIRQDHGTWRAGGDVAGVLIPPTIQALLSTRLDGLPEDERRVIELASVVGREFWHAAVAAVAPSDLAERIAGLLEALVRKDLIVPERSTVTGDDSFRFRHILIRDAAYASLPKLQLAGLHERFASWLADSFVDRLAEVEEIVGYHLQQAHQQRVALGPGGPDLAPLAQRAAAHLIAAGRRALARNDTGAATSLLERARSLLLPDSPSHRQVGLDVAYAFARAGAFERARVVLEAVESEAAAVGEDVTVAHARVDVAAIMISVAPEGAAAAAQREADAAMAVFQRAGDQLGIAKALILRVEQDHMLARFAPFRQAYEQALVHLKDADDRSRISGVLGNIAHAVCVGPTPIPEAIARIESILAEAGGNRDLRARATLRLGVLMAYQGREAEALSAEAQAEADLRDLGVEFSLGSFGLMAGELERCLGRLDRAEHVLRLSDHVFERSGELSVRSTALAVLAQVLVEQGRIDEAEQTATLAMELGSSDDIGTLLYAHGALGRLLAARGDPGAEEVARRAVTLAEQTDMLCLQGDQWENLAEVLLAAGRTADANAARREAIDRYDRKGAVSPADRVRGRLQ